MRDVVFDYRGGCRECGGCTDDRCGGSCGQRWCGGGGGYMGEGCDRCPKKVWREGVKGAKPGQAVKVRCNGPKGHRGQCDWLPERVGREEVVSHQATVAGWRAEGEAGESFWEYMERVGLVVGVTGLGDSPDLPRV